MRPEAMTPPARLFETECRVGRASDIDAGIDGPSAWTPYVVDLAEVRALRQVYDFDEGAPSPDETIAELIGGDTSRVRTPYPALLAAWRAYRAHADALGRIRN